MIVICGGMIKSGSAWYVEMANKLLVAAGYADARQIRERFSLGDIMLGNECYVRQLSLGSLFRLYRVKQAGHTFAVKTHAPLPLYLAPLLWLNTIKATYIFRDPRDVVVSALDHGRKLRAEGITTNFGAYSTCADLLPLIDNYQRVWSKWDRIGGVLRVRYEDLLADTPGELRRLARHLRLTLAERTIEQIVDRYRPERLNDRKKDDLHFNRGVIGRYKQALTAGQIAVLNERYAGWLQKMGYPLNA